MSSAVAVIVLNTPVEVKAEPLAVVIPPEAGNSADVGRWGISWR